MMRQLRQLIAVLLLMVLAAADQPVDEFRADEIFHNWGPYTERYAGVSHIADIERGLRFDLSVFPVTPGKRNLPFENSGHSSIYTYWAARPRLEDYTIRFIMDRNKEAWCDISYFEKDQDSRLFRVDMQNRGGKEWSGDLHLLAHLRYPPKDYFARIGNTSLRSATVHLPEDAIWLPSLDYVELNLPEPDTRDALPERGLLRREARAQGSVGGSLLGRGFGGTEGDEVVYRFNIEEDIRDALLLLRGRSDGDREASFQLEGPVRETLSFPVGNDFVLLPVSAGTLKAGKYELKMISEGTGSVLFDGFVVVPADLEDEVRFTVEDPHAAPSIRPVENGKGLILSYPGIEQVYGYAINLPIEGDIRSLRWDELYAAFGERWKISEEDRIHGGGRYGSGDADARFIDLGFTPEPVPDGGSRQYWGLVCQGSEEQVRARLEGFLNQPAGEFADQAPSFEMLPPYNADGEPYAFGQQLMTAATAMNIIFPQRHERRYIVGYTPAKLWGVMYTWDNGVHGIGLNILDTELSAALMYQMTTSPGAETPYIWGGSPMPIQFYQFREWWNRCQDRETMEVLYPRLKQMYEWFIGRGHGSNTRGPAKDGMISTYQYFYNLGWDDYPGHTFARMVDDRSWPAPVCQSVHTLIGARALAQAARELGLKGDVAVYEADARELEQAILEDAWDGKSGYYGYVAYDHETGKPLGIIRGREKVPSDERPHRNRENLEAYIGGDRGVNINMGLDGVAPWYAGIGSPEQREQQFGLLTAEGRLWTSVGLLTVDLESPFSCEGYWIDRAWIPPQWWFWKGALDQGKGDFAYRVAHAVLQNARYVAEKDWNTYENFSYSQKEPGGNGLNFAGLSTPSLDFFHSYYVPGTISFGHDAWVEDTEWNEEKTGVSCRVRFGQERPGESRLVLACLHPGGEVTAKWKGKKVPVEKITDGAVYVRLPSKKESGKLVIKQKGS